MTAEPQKVLFLCSGNSCRSQMAEAILRDLAGDQMEVYSAGLEPAEIHPLTRKVLAEIELDMAGQYAKSVKEYLGTLPVNTMIVVCDKAARSCPSIWPGSPRMETLHWAFDDPAAVEGSDEEKLAAFRRVRDEIRARLTEWVAQQEATSQA